jgi:divinyl protochlorophyllide a 8-vinyl-reductase
MPTGQIGPNAVIQVASVLAEWSGREVAEPLLHRATGYTMDHLPSSMVDEREPQALCRAVLHAYGPREARRILHEGGIRTAEYLLANRIPRPAQWIIRALPRALGLRVLLAAVGAHAWTFAGSGRFRVVPTARWPELEFADCVMCRGLAEAEPMCDYYAGTFERLIRRLVSPDAVVMEIACQGQGDPACRFRLEQMGS